MMLASVLLAVQLTVPLEVGEGNGLQLVKGSLEGVPCTMIFDTGATHTSFDLDFVTNAFPKAELIEIGLAGTSNVNVMPRLMKTESLKVGEMDYQGFPVMVIPFPGLSNRVGRKVDGILGMDIIRRMPMILSVKESKLILNPDKVEGFGPRLKFDYSDFDGSPKVFYKGKDGAPRSMLIDSGSSFTILTRPEDWAATGEAIDLGAMSVNGREELKMRFGEPGELELVPAEAGAEVKVTVRPMINPDHPCAYLGADTLRKYDLYLKFPEVRLR